MFTIIKDIIVPFDQVTIEGNENEIIVQLLDGFNYHVER